MSIKDLFRKSVFLLGAGASVDAGCMTSRGMLSDLLLRINSLADEKLKNVYAEIYSFLFATLKYKFSLEKQDELVARVINIEDFFMLLRQLMDKEAIVPDPFVGTWNNKILKWEFYNPNIFIEFRDFIIKNLREYWTKSEDIKSKDLLEPLKELTTNTSIDSLDFFTLNYDLVFETLFKSGEELEIGFSSKVWRACFENYACPSGGVSMPPAKLKYYKLHGSLDWWYDSDDEEVRLVDDVSKNTAPFIVFGTNDKVISVEPFLYLLGKFRERLSIADLYIVIGYSFSDQHINNLLLQQLKSNTIKKLMVIDSEYKTETDVAENRKRLLEYIEDIQIKKSSGDFKNIIKISEEKIDIVPLTAKEFYKEYFSNSAKKLQEYYESMVKSEQVF